MAQSIIIVKQTDRGEHVWDYPGEVVARGDTWVCIRAPFSGSADRDLGYVVFRRGDTFVEWHYSDRWYNVFRDLRRGRWAAQGLVLQRHPPSRHHRRCRPRRRSGARRVRLSESGNSGVGRR
ncbi:MAG: hypothetical protein U0521_23185 [Anaerolineae bacterium]